MDREAVRTVVAEGLTRPIPQTIRREVAIPTLAHRASVLKGVRRCGKTYRMFQHMNELASQGVDRQHMLFVDFEDDRLDPFPTSVISDVVEEYLRVVPPTDGATRYLFFDEVQNIEGWGRVLRRLTEDPRFTICVTGSSAKMLSDDVATEFRGRSISAEIYPYSFREYLRAHGLEPTQIPSPDERRIVKNAFEEYLCTGGFPEVQDSDVATRVSALQEIVRTVTVRDLAERHDVPILGARRFVQRALRCSGREFSANKVYNDLKSLGISLPRSDAFDLPQHCEDAYLFFLISRFGAGYDETHRGKRKLYAVDPGLQFATGASGSADLGQRLETAVYLELRRRLHGDLLSSIGFLRTTSGYEVDFAVGDEEDRTVRELYQVCADSQTASTATREERALSEALDQTGLDRATLVVLDARHMAKPSDPRIDVVEAWEWMLATS